MQTHSQLSLGWVLPRPFAGSGGLNNIFGMIGTLQQWGHASVIYCCDVENEFASDEALADYIQSHWGLHGIECVRDARQFQPHDILLATHCSTVSKVREDARSVRKCYFVQDFEPLFFPMGNEYLLAENTYACGLPCITLGRWLERFLRENYLLDTCGFDFPVDAAVYQAATNSPPQPFDIVYYAQPDKPRRAFELGCEALRLVKRARPETSIAMFGSDSLADAKVLFAYRDFGLQKPRELANLYQQSKIGLVLSTSNPSLIPCEMMACGSAVVDLLRENNLFDYRPGTIRLAEQTPEAVAAELLALLQHEDDRQRQVAASYDMVRERSYEASARTVEGALLRLLVTGRVSPAESPCLDLSQDIVNQECEIPAEGSGEIRQSFVCRLPNLTRIDVGIHNHGEQSSGQVVLQLKEAGSGEIIHRAARPCAPSPDNHFLEFALPPIPDSERKTFVLSLSYRAEDAAARRPAALYAQSADLCPQGALTIGDTAVDGTLRFRTFCRPHLKPHSVVRAAIFERALELRGQSLAEARDLSVSNLQSVYKQLPLIERRASPAAPSESARKQKLRGLLRLLNTAKPGEPQRPIQDFVKECRRLFRDELEEVEREEQAKALFEKAREAEASERWPEVERFVVETLRKRPDHQDALLLHGRVLLRQNRAKEAFAQLNRLLSLNPRCAAAFNEIGQRMQQVGMLREAKVLFTRATHCQPQEREGWLNLVQLHYQEGTLAEGRIILDQWLKRKPGDAEGLRLRARYDQHPDSAKTKPAAAPSIRGRQPGRQLKVATLLAEPDEFACPYLRVTSVLRQLEQQGCIQRLRATAIQNGRVQVLPELLQQADIILVQRQMAGLLPYAALRQHLGARSPRIVFDLDDALTLLPESHRAHAAYQGIAAFIEEYLRRADLVTVSTRRLAELYGPFNPNIAVLPNFVDAKLWSPPSSGRRPSDKISILFSGTLDHEGDLQVAEPALIEVLAAYGNRVEFLYWGNVTERLRRLPQVKPAHEFQPDYREYAARLRKLPVDFTITPLADSEFNRAKSHIKWLEYSMCRLPGIYSDLPAYNQIVEHGRTGLLVPNSSEAWVAAIKSLVDNPARREQLALQAQEEVLARHTVESNARLWLQACEACFESRGQPAAPASAPSVSVIIPVFNKLDLTQSCLQSIRDNTPSTQCEIVVVDNGSTDGTAGLLRDREAAGELRVVRNSENLGFAKACNQGALAARGRYLLFLNNDTRVQPAWLEPLVALAEADPSIAAVGSKLLFPDGTIQHAGVAMGQVAGRDPLLPVHTYYKSDGNLPAANQRRIYPALSAACVLVRKSAFDAIGGFDEQFWNGYEDVDLCLRFQERGWQLVYEPASVVVHLESQSGPARFQKVQQNIRRLHEKWLGKVNLDVMVASDGSIAPAETTRIRPYERPADRAPRTSIIILVHNQLEHTRRCLDSIARCTPERHELILVDNGSTDGTADFFRDYSKQHENVRIITNRLNLGFAAGNNQALALAGGDFVVLLNNDTVATPGWLTNMLAVFRQHSGAGIVGPRSNCVLGKQVVENPGYQALDALPAFAAKWAEQHAGQSRPANRVIGFCLLARRSVIDRIGGLDERFGSGNFEDDDFCIRAGLAGFETRIADDAFVHHVGNTTFKGAGIDYRQAMLANWDLFKQKWGIPADAPPQQGYLTPKAPPPGVVLEIPLKLLQPTHEPSADGRQWREKEVSRPATLPVSPSKTQAAPWPACARLGQLTGARDLMREKNFPEAWAQTCAAIQERPFHPEAFLLLAEIALAAGDSGSARECAQRARSLAPDWKAPKQFLQKPLKGDTRQDWLVLPEVISKFNSDPSRAGSQISNQLTVCVIARDEEQFLDRCLKSAKPIASQIVVVDTGSTDRTIEIAKAHGAEVHQFEWCDDFAAARNAALEHAKGDWILVLDADEELPADQRARLETDLSDAKSIGIRLPLVNKGREAEGLNYVPRLFRNAPGAFFHGRIHEQIFPSLIALSKGWGLRTALGTAQILHHGYDEEVLKDRNKIGRNLRLLRQAVQECPADANLLMNFGLELIRSGDAPEGVRQYREAFRLMSAQPPGEVVPELREVLLTQFTCQLYKEREHAEVVRVLTSRLAKNGGLSASLHFALGLSHFELKNHREAAEQLRQCLGKRLQPALSPLNTDILTAAPQHCLALSLVQLGDAAGAEKAFAAALLEKGRIGEVKLDYARFLLQQNRVVDALHCLHEVVSEDSRNIKAWRLGGEIALSRPDFLNFAYDWSGEAMRYAEDDDAVIAQRAEVLMLREETAGARVLWEKACNGARPPRALAAWVLCSAVEFEPVPAIRGPEEEAAVSRVFVEWYQRLVSAGARETVKRLNSRLDVFRECLPTAAQLLESALCEVQKQVA